VISAEEGKVTTYVLCVLCRVCCDSVVSVYSNIGTVFSISHLQIWTYVRKLSIWPVIELLTRLKPVACVECSGVSPSLLLLYSGREWYKLYVDTRGSLLLSTIEWNSINSYSFKS